MDALKEWVRGLVMLVILASLLELLLPMNAMKRFVRMAMGLLVVLGVTRPIVGLLGQPVDVDPGLLVSKEAALPSMHQIMADAGRFQEKNQALLLKEVEARLTAEVRAAARKVDGVADARVALKLARSGSMEQYRVEGVTVTVQPGSRFGQVPPVTPVQVQPVGQPAAGSAGQPAAGSAGQPAAGSAGQPAAGFAGQPPTQAETALADAVRREVAARLGLTDARLIQVLVDRPAQPRR